MLKRKTLIGKFDNGGISMPDIECIVAAAKAAWVTKVFKKENLIDFISNYLKHYGLNANVITRCEFTDKNEISDLSLPRFYKEVSIHFSIQM